MLMTGEPSWEHVDGEERKRENCLSQGQLGQSPLGLDYVPLFNHFNTLPTQIIRWRRQDPWCRGPNSAPIRVPKASFPSWPEWHSVPWLT